MTGIQLLKYKDYTTYWYKVEYTSGGKTYTGYSYAGDSTATPLYSVSVSNVKAPTGTREVGAKLTLEGNISSSVLPLSNVGAFVYSGSATSGSALTGVWASTSAKTYSIKGSTVDYGCKIGSLSQGVYTYTIKAKVKNTWATSGTAIASETRELLLHSNSFSEGVTYYTVSYNANGGTNAPASQTKVHGTALTLTTSKPSRANESLTGYTVTLNANGGNVSSNSLTAARTRSYNFSSWNTKADGTGTQYTSGDSYTANASATLYAQWISSIRIGSVTLPTPTRTGYTFKGWATSSSASSGATGVYSPTGNVTLYAIWKQEAKAEWRKVNGKWYYYYADGSYAVGWARINSKWYYFDSAGIMKTGWLLNGGKWYYLDSTGAMSTGWQKISDKWYYFKSSGAMVTGWQKISNKWYYLESSGAMVTGWKTINGKTYYFKSDGAMAVKEWCDGYWLNAEGTWTYPYKASWKHNSSGWWYGDASGWYAKNATITIDGRAYTFNAQGYWIQ